MSIKQSTSFLVGTIDRMAHHNNNYTHPLFRHGKIHKTQYSIVFISPIHFFR